MLSVANIILSEYSLFVNPLILVIASVIIISEDKYSLLKITLLSNLVYLISDLGIKIVAGYQDSIGTAFINFSSYAALIVIWITIIFNSIFSKRKVKIKQKLFAIFAYPALAVLHTALFYNFSNISHGIIREISSLWN